MVATISIVLGTARVEPAALSAEEWSSILQEAKGDLTLDYLRGMQSVRQIIQPDDPSLRITYRADPAVIRKGIRSIGVRQDDVLLYCATLSDTTFPHDSGVQLRKDGDCFASSYVALAKRDEEVCQQIRAVQYRDACYGKVAVQLGNASICEFITNADVKGECGEDVRHASAVQTTQRNA